MNQPIPVRYFALAVQDTEDSQMDVVEITRREFEGQITREDAKITYERNTVFMNGVSQICLTVECADSLYAEDLELIK